METDAAIDVHVLSEPALRALCDAWLEDTDAAAAARPLSEVELLALMRAGDVGELLPTRAPP